MGYIRVDIDRGVLNDVMNKLGGIENIDNSTLLKGLEAGGTILLNAVKSNAPVRTGRMKNAIRMNRHLGDRPYVDIRFSEKKKARGGARYWWLVENGHGGPKPAPPHPFMEPAINEVAGDAENAVVIAIADELFKGW